MEYEIAIIGAGPAGLSAAIYCLRSNIKTIIIGFPYKSRAALAHKIENYFGFEEISGTELIERGVKQVKKFGGEIIEKEAVKIKKKDHAFEIELEDGKKLNAKAIIIATGISNKTSGIINEKDYVGKGVSYCIECDGPFFKNKKVGVVGNGNYAAKEALDVLRYTKDVTIFTNGLEPKISEDLLNELKKNNIKFDERKIKRLLGDPLLSEIEFENGEKTNISGLFIAIGIASSTDFANQLALNLENSFILVDRNSKTSIDGVYAAGDCTGGVMQIAKAVGDGAKAAINAISYVKNRKVMPQWG